jgi:pimeloyl-ACP methyl ester carboxylesterase
MEAERAAKEAAAQARCNLVSDLDAENAAEHAMVAKAAATAAATHLAEVEAKLAAASSGGDGGDGGGGGAGLKLAPATIERVPRLFFKPLRTLGAMQAAVEPHPIESRLGRIVAPVILLLGDKRSSSAPTATQIQLLQTLVKRYTTDTVPVSGTMLHEERPGDVAQAISTLVRRVQREGRD